MDGASYITTDCRLAWFGCCAVLRTYSRRAMYHLTGLRGRAGGVGGATATSQLTVDLRVPCSVPFQGVLCTTCLFFTCRARYFPRKVPTPLYIYIYLFFIFFIYLFFIFYFFIYFFIIFYFFYLYIFIFHFYIFNIEMFGS